MRQQFIFLLFSFFYASTRSSHALIFGGRGIDSKGKEGFLNDLWISEDMVQFGWYEGSNERNARSQFHNPGATPSGRWKHACAAHPESKSFIVFGGVGEHPDDPKQSAILDDVFLYGEHGWQFLAGGEHSQAPDFHNKNAKMRNPGGRADHASAMVENLFYVFGGQSVMANEKGETSEVMMADLWSFDVKGHYWTFVSGSSVANMHGQYPMAIGVGGESFGPGARVGAAMAFNQLTNELFVFGGFGFGYIPGRTGYLNDLWSYNTYKPVSTWTWLGGSSNVNSPGGMVGNVGFPASIPSRANGLLFSGNDGYEAELTLIGGVALESADKPEGIADVWMCNVNLPPAFTMLAPSTTMPTSVIKPTASVKPTVALPTAAPGTHHNQDTHKDSKPTTSEPTHAVASPSVASTTKGNGRAQAPGSTVPPSLFEVGSPQKVAALVLGSFIAIVLLVGGIVFLGFAFVSSPATASGSRSVMEPYNQV